MLKGTLGYKTVISKLLVCFDMDSVLSIDSVAVDSILLQAVRIEIKHKIIIIILLFINESLPDGLIAIYIVPVIVPVGSCQVMLLLSSDTHLPIYITVVLRLVSWVPYT